MNVAPRIKRRLRNTNLREQRRQYRVFLDNGTPWKCSSFEKFADRCDELKEQRAAGWIVANVRPLRDIAREKRSAFSVDLWQLGGAIARTEHRQRERQLREIRARVCTLHPPWFFSGCVSLRFEIVPSVEARDRLDVSKLNGTRREHRSTGRRTRALARVIECATPVQSRTGNFRVEQRGDNYLSLSSR